MRWIVTRTVLSCCLLIAPFASLGFEKQALPPNEWVDLLNRGYELWDIFCDPNVPGRLFATGLVIQSESVDDQLMFPILSTDSGTTWKPLTSSISDWGYVFSPDDISLSVVCPDSTQRILYCIRGVAENRCLIFRSTDLGVSWINSGEATNCLATAVQAHPTHDWLLASRSSYYSESVGNTNHTGNVELIMKSTDGGATWTQKAYYNSPSSLTGISRFCFNPIQTEHVIAVCRSGFGEKLLMSTDSGENWQAIDTGPDWQLDTGVRGIAFHPTQPDTFVAIHDDFFSEMHHSLKRTTDRGATWSDWGPEDCSAVGFFFHTDNPEVMFTVSESSTDSIYKSTDTGLSWVVKREYSEEQGNVKTRSVFMIPNGDTDLYCNISGLLRSKDMGESWGAMYFVDGSFNRNSAWIDPTNEQNILISQEYIGTFCTFDAGDHWEVLSSGYENGFDLGLYQSLPCPSAIYSLFNKFDTENNSQRMLRKSTDMGTTWVEIPLEADWGIVECIPSRNDSNRVFVRGRSGYPDYTQYYFKTDDQGITWQQIEIPDEFRIRDFFDDPDISDRWYIIVDSENPSRIVQIWISDDAGLTWRAISANKGFTPDLDNTDTVSICMHPVDHNLIYANCGGLFYSSDRGESWTYQAVNHTSGGSIVADPFNIDILYANWQVGLGMCRSVTRGIIWSRSDYPYSVYPSRTDQNILFDTAQMRIMRIDSKPPVLQLMGFWTTNLQSDAAGKISLYVLAADSDINDEVIGIDMYAGDTYLGYRLSDQVAPDSGLFSSKWHLPRQPAGTFSITLRAVDRFGQISKPSGSIVIP